MNVDHYFTIGADHQRAGTPCEDYALSGHLSSGAAFGVVTDGCSGANANTDVGARALAWAFKKSAQDVAIDSDLWISPDFLSQLQAVFKEHQYSGSQLDYLATLVGFIATEDRVDVHVQGDGALAILHADGLMSLFQFGWLNEMPFYLQYKSDDAAITTFQQLYPHGIVEPFSVRGTLFRSANGVATVTSEMCRRYALDEVYDGHTMSFSPKVDNIVAVAVMSDGIDRVRNVPSLEAVRELMAFKNHQGSFVKRRMMRALEAFRKFPATSSDASSTGIPGDDISMAVVWFPQGEQS